jgi:RNA polymerase sigma-70 factor (ECF subfamily)
VGGGFQRPATFRAKGLKPGEDVIPSKSVMGAQAAPPAAGEVAGRAAEGAEDRELVRRAQGGDEAAFRRLVERHGGRAHALALRILRSASDAEEVAQDAFVRAWRALPGFRGDSAFGSWLYRIVARRAFDRAAVLKGRRARETDIETAEDLPAAVSGPDPAAGERSRRLERLLAALPEVPRTVVTLYYLEDRSVQEVAETLRMPENTVKTHLHRARAALRSAWIREDEAP